MPLVCKTRSARVANKRTIDIRTGTVIILDIFFCFVPIIDNFLALFFTENVGSGEDLFEGDMRLTFEQRVVINEKNGRGSIRTKKWTGAVMPYVVDSSLGKEFLSLNPSATKNAFR